MNTPVTPGAQQGGPADLDETDGGGLTAFRVGALTSQSEIDKYKNIYGAAFESAAYKTEETGWDGLTKGQEVAAAQVAQEHEREIEELQEQEDETLRTYQETLDKLYERRDEVAKQIEHERENAALLSNGQRAYKGDDGDPNYYNENGDRIDDPNLIKEAKAYDAAHPGTMTKQSDIKKNIDQYNGLTTDINQTAAQMEKAQAAGDARMAGVRSGSISTADARTAMAGDAATAQNNAQAIDAKIAAQRAGDPPTGISGNTTTLQSAQATVLQKAQLDAEIARVQNAMVAHDKINVQATDQVTGKVASTGAAIADETTNGDNDDFYSMGDDTGSEPDTQSAAISTTRNTTVAGQQFGATSDLSSKGPFAAASAPVSIAALPEATQENNGSTQRIPGTPSPSAVA